MKTKKLLILVVLAILLCGQSFAQEIGEWRTTTDFTIHHSEKGYNLPDAYTLAIIANYYSVKKFEEVGFSWWQADLTTFTLGVAWEVKDGLVPLEEVPIFGGNGFSTTDIAVNAGVIVTNRILKFGLSKVLGYVSNNTKLNLVAK